MTTVCINPSAVPVNLVKSSFQVCWFYCFVFVCLNIWVQSENVQPAVYCVGYCSQMERPPPPVVLLGWSADNCENKCEIRKAAVAVGRAGPSTLRYFPDESESLIWKHRAVKMKPLLFRNINKTTHTTDVTCTVWSKQKFIIYSPALPDFTLLSFLPQTVRSSDL